MIDTPSGDPPRLADGLRGLLSVFLSGFFCRSFLSRSSLSLHGSLELCESGEITKSGLLYLRQIESGFLSLSSFLSSLSRSLFALLPSAEVAYENTLSVAVELDYLERQFVANSYRALVLFLEVTGCAECLNALFQTNNSALVGQFNYFTIYDGVYAELSFESDGG